MSQEARSAATAPGRPEVESLEDLWCWLNIWGDLLHKHQARTRPDRLSTEWRKGYEQGVRDAMDKLEQVGVTWETVPDETWRKWSGRNG